MSAPRYLWRKLTPEQRAELLKWRQDHNRPWHSPPHRPNNGHLHFLISAACYEHAPHIGHSPVRMDDFTADLLSLLQQTASRIVAWCVLPNHYHTLVEAADILSLLRELGRLHGRSSFAWNGEEKRRGRQVFHGATERFMWSERHFLATINYVHNNPVHHGYTRLWTEWRWSSAAEYLERTGRVEAERVWREYPILGYGAKWDDPAI